MIGEQNAPDRYKKIYWIVIAIQFILLITLGYFYSGRYGDSSFFAVWLLIVGSVGFLGSLLQNKRRGRWTVIVIYILLLGMVISSIYIQSNHELGLPL